MRALLTVQALCDGTPLKRSRRIARSTVGNAKLVEVTVEPAIPVKWAIHPNACAEKGLARADLGALDALAAAAWDVWRTKLALIVLVVARSGAAVGHG
jgi:hypothetical protein